MVEKKYPPRKNTADRSYPPNLDVRFNNDEEKRIRDAFEEIVAKLKAESPDQSMSGRARDLLVLDVQLYRHLGSPANLDTVFDLISGWGDLQKAASEVGIGDAIAHAKKLLEIDITSRRVRGVGIDSRVCGSSLAHNLPRDPDSVKKLLAYLKKCEFKASRKTYNSWLLMAEPDGFEKGAICPSFLEFTAIANYLFPGSRQEMESLAELWEGDRDRQRNFQRQQDAQVLNNLNHDPFLSKRLNREKLVLV